MKLMFGLNSGKIATIAVSVHVVRPAGIFGVRRRGDDGEADEHQGAAAAENETMGNWLD